MGARRRADARRRRLLPTPLKDVQRPRRVMGHAGTSFRKVCHSSLLAVQTRIRSAGKRGEYTVATRKDTQGRSDRNTRWNHSADTGAFWNVSHLTPANAVFCKGWTGVKSISAGHPK